MQPDLDGWWNLPEGHYEVVMENVIEVGPNEAGWVITRSTFNRNGVFLTSGLYDTGYNGIMAAMMHVTCGPLRIRRDTRIGQYICFEAESLSNYSGSYGLGTEHDKKYGVVKVKADKINLKKLSTEEIAKTPKTGLTWYQIKKINAAKRQVIADQKKRAKENEEAARKDLEERRLAVEKVVREDAVQATITHVVVNNTNNI